MPLTPMDQELSEYLVTNFMFRCLNSARPSYPCPYCKLDIPTSSDIYGTYGVRWGHLQCVLHAYQEGELLPSKANADRRPVPLEGRLITSAKSIARKLQMHKQMTAPAWSPTALGKPDCTCPHFPPKLIKVVSLPEELQINKRVADEMGAEEQSKAENAIWARFLEKWFGSYKRTTRELPFCPIHQWSTANKDRLQLRVAYVNGNKFNTQRALWWFCPGETP